MTKTNLKTNFFSHFHDPYFVKIPGIGLKTIVFSFPIPSHSCYIMLSNILTVSHSSHRNFILLRKSIFQFHQVLELTINTTIIEPWCIQDTILIDLKPKPYKTFKMASNTDINVVNRMMDNNKDREDPFQRDAMVMYFLRFSNIEMRLRVFRKPTLR